MSKLKIVPEIFLESIELNRLVKFIDESGFRLFLLEQAVQFGLIKKEIDNTFSNGRVTESSDLTIQHSVIRAIDKNGNYISKPQTSLIAVPPNNQFYWVKIKYLQSPIELGTFSIDTSGNLVGVGSELTKIIRGNIDFPSRIKFSNSTNNILEYDVVEVINDNNAVLQGASFIAETDLKLIVVGTFTAGSTPLESDKQIFQYDSCTLSLVEEEEDQVPPNKIEGEEFYIARVQSDGGSLLIEDKRTEFFETKDGYFLKNLTTLFNPLVGVEQITYDNTLSVKTDNLVNISWCFRSSNWTINTNNNILTLNSGKGGRYKDTTQFANGDFDKWRVYTKDGSYRKITTSSKTGSQINLTLDNLEPTKFSVDTEQELLICPDAEEIELIFKANVDDTTPIPERRFVFPINTPIGKCSLLVYKATNSLYNLKYRYKQVRDYSPTFLCQSDGVGFYNEAQFTSLGNLIEEPIRTTYNAITDPEDAGFIPLVLHTSAYSNFVTKIDTGDLFGVDSKVISNAVAKIDLFVGYDKSYQIFSDATTPTLNADHFIVLNKTLVTALGDAIRDGNNFILHFKQKIIPSTFKIRIVQDYVDSVTYTLLREFTQEDFNCASETLDGLIIRAVYDADNTTWIVSSSDHGIKNFASSTANAIVGFSTGSTALLNIGNSPDIEGDGSFGGGYYIVPKAGVYSTKIEVQCEPASASEFFFQISYQRRNAAGDTIKYNFNSPYFYAKVSAGFWPGSMEITDPRVENGDQIRVYVFYSNITGAIAASIFLNLFECFRIKP